MSSKLHQIQLSYNAENDRMILTLSTQDFCEYRFWITRRLLPGFWGVLQKLQESMLKDEEQQREEVIQTASQIQQEAPRQEAGKYSMRVTKRPLGEEPQLLQKFTARYNEQGQVAFSFEDPNGNAVNFAGEGILVTVLCQLVRNILPLADWGLAI